MSILDCCLHEFRRSALPRVFALAARRIQRRACADAASLQDFQRILIYYLPQQNKKKKEEKIQRVLPWTVASESSSRASGAAMARWARVVLGGGERLEQRHRVQPRMQHDWKLNAERMRRARAARIDPAGAAQDAPARSLAPGRVRCPKPGCTGRFANTLLFLVAFWRHTSNTQHESAGRWRSATGVAEKIKDLRGIQIFEILPTVEFFFTSCNVFWYVFISVKYWLAF